MLSHFTKPFFLHLCVWRLWRDAAIFQSITKRWAVAVDVSSLWCGSAGSRPSPSQSQTLGRQATDLVIQGTFNLTTASCEDFFFPLIRRENEEQGDRGLVDLTPECNAFTHSHCRVPERDVGETDDS